MPHVVPGPSPRLLSASPTAVPGSRFGELLGLVTEIRLGAIGQVLDQHLA
jgi:hypothetical protein